MTLVTAKEVESIIQGAIGYWDEWSISKVLSLTINDEVYPLSIVDSYTGSEGDYAAETYIVFRVGEQTFKKTGYYRSHYGDDWDGPVVEVTKGEKTITTWEAKVYKPFTVAGVAEAVEEDGDGWSEFRWEGPDSIILDGETYPVKIVDTYGGGEGQGEVVFVVFTVGDRMFKKNGYYASHYGTDWDGDLVEVEAFEKTVTDYRAI